MKDYYILILGAASDIAQELAYLYAEDGYNLYLASRNLALLNRLAKDLIVRYNIDVRTFYFDAIKYETHFCFIKNFFLNL